MPAPRGRRLRTGARAGARAGVRAGLWLVLAAAAPAAAAPPLVVDLSDRLVAITTGFAGARVLLFGAVAGAGDIIVVVRGPEADAVVRRKSRVAGIWVNTDAVVFADVPGFYHLASTAPVDELLPESVLRRRRLGTGRLGLAPAEATDAATAAEFAAALQRNRERAGLYAVAADGITLIDGRLFSAPLFLPANVPTGAYTAETLLVRHGRVVATASTRLAVSKTGFEERTYRFAHEQSALYGLIAVLAALVAGWLAGLVFRKA